MFARGICHLGPFKDGPGVLRGRVSIGGCVIADGDLIVGDEDGIAVVERRRAWEILGLAEAKVAKEAAQRAAIANGTTERSWVDAALTIIEVDRPGGTATMG